MAPQSFVRADLDKASMRFAEIYSGPLSPSPLSDDASIFSTVQGPPSALRCAKGTLTAIGLEAFTASMVYCLYEMLRRALLFR